VTTSPSAFALPMELRMPGQGSHMLHALPLCPSFSLFFIRFFCYVGSASLVRDELQWFTTPSAYACVVNIPGSTVAKRRRDKAETEELLPQQRCLTCGK
jgi:hypothetical protein